MTNPFQANTSVVKKSAAIKVSQCACRNRHQVLFLPRTGAGSNPLRRRMLSNGGIAHLRSEIVQGTDDAVAAPGRIFLDQFDDEFFKSRLHGRSTDWILPPLDAKSPYFARRENKMSTYLMSDVVAGWPNNPSVLYRSCKITSAWNTMCWIMWEEDENLGAPPIGYSAYLCGASWPDPTGRHPDAALGYRHGSGAVVLAVGGQARLVTYREFLTERAYTNKGLIWWSPWSADGR